MQSESNSAAKTATAKRQRFDRLIDLPPSAKLVYRVLSETDQPLTNEALIKRTLLPGRTVRYALKQLTEADLVEQHPVIHDARQTAYTGLPVERYYSYEDG